MENGKPLKDVEDMVNWKDGVLILGKSGQLRYLPPNTSYDFALDPTKEDRIWVTPIPATDPITGRALHFNEFPAAEVFEVNEKEIRDVKALATSGSHVVALTRDGGVVAWGDNAQGQTEVPANLNRQRC